MTRWCRGATLADTSGTSADAAGDLNQEVTLRRVLRLRGARSRAPRGTGADRPTGRTAGGGSWLGTTDTSPRPKTVMGGSRRGFGTCERPLQHPEGGAGPSPVSYTHLRAHETPEHLVCRLLLEK